MWKKFGRLVFPLLAFVAIAIQIRERWTGSFSLTGFLIGLIVSGALLFAVRAATQHKMRETSTDVREIEFFKRWLMWVSAGLVLLVSFALAFTYPTTKS
ncbi:hypothetical protein [Methylobacterium sp. Leaf94]|uniref:hypothetical protein n=1 Tax=Methylobacterium sp. Leaf94 TaxID=1736250 RepID=UPI000B0A1CEC|nr:hypothetical protein [Methylobacterium sp. Leaf94]